MRRPLPKPRLTGSDGEFLIPQEIEGTEDVTNSDDDQYNESAEDGGMDEPGDNREVDVAENDSEEVEPEPEVIPHQLFYPLIGLLWIGVCVIVGPMLPQDYEQYKVNPLYGFVLPVAGLVATLLIYVPAALFDKLFPNSTRLSMTQTYVKALKISINFVTAGRVRFRG